MSFDLPTSISRNAKVEVEQLGEKCHKVLGANKIKAPLFRFDRSDFKVNDEE